MDLAPTRRRDAAELVKMYYWEMWDDNFEGIADRLLKVYAKHASPYGYVIEVFEQFQSSVSGWEDSIAAAFVDRLLNRELNKFAADREGSYALTLFYQAMITGKATEFEREQANRIIKAKLKATGPEKFVKMASARGRQGERYRTPIFPIRFMRVTGGDYAPPEVKLRSNGHLLVKYPSNMQSMSTFKEEIRTLGDVFGAGMDVNVNEIVGIRDYERGGEVIYLPALALIDYANQAIESTSGKIVEVSLTVATLGIGGGAAAGRVAAERTDHLNGNMGRPSRPGGANPRSRSHRRRDRRFRHKRKPRLDHQQARRTRPAPGSALRHRQQRGGRLRADEAGPGVATTW